MARSRSRPVAYSRPWRACRGGRGGDGSHRLAAPQRCGGRSSRLDTLAERQSVLAGSNRTREYLASPRCSQADPEVASLRFFFPSAFTNRARCSSRRQPAFGPSRFDVRSVLAVLSRHSSSQAADVTRARDRGSEDDHAPPASILGGVPLSVPKGSGLADRPAVLHFEGRPGRTGNAHGIFQTLRSLDPASQAEDRLSRVLTARMPFHECPPWLFCVRGSIAKSAIPIVSADRSWTFIAASGICLLQSSDG